MLVYWGHATVRGLAAVVLLCCLAAPVAAQTKLSGVIKDMNGRAATDVPVVARNERTGQRSATRSTDIGYYQFVKLPPGKYKVIVDLAPFKPIIATVEVTSKMRAVCDIRLEMRTEDQIEVRMNTSPPALLAPDGSIGSTFTREMLDSTTLTNGRTLQSILSLVPGIVVTDSVGTLAQFTAVGQRRLSNRLTIDGISADLAVDARGQGVGAAGSGGLPAFSTLGSTQTLVPMAAIEEIQVRTTNASSEQARSPGAQTSVVTRSGGNRFAGSGFLDARPDRLMASDWFDNGETRLLVGSPTQHTDYWNVGASIGGPLLPKRLFSFATWERQQIDRPLSATIPVPSNSMRQSASAIARRFLDTFPRPNGAELEDGLAEYSGLFPATASLSTLSVRLDFNGSERHRVFARINTGRSSGDSVNDYQQPLLSFASVEATSTRTFTAGLMSTFSSFTHDLRLNVSTHRGSLTANPTQRSGTDPLPLDLLVAPGSETDPWVRFSLFVAPGGFLISGRSGAGSQDQLQAVDTWSFLRGRHEWRLGFDYRRLTATTNPVPIGYTYRFNNVAEFLQGAPGQVTLGYYNPARVRIQTWAAFAQDAFRISPRLSLNYGLRYSVRPAPVSLTKTQPLLLNIDALPQLEPLSTGTRLWNTSWTNIAPQAAVKYQLSAIAGRETALHAGWSLAFDDLTNPGAIAFGRGYPYASRLFIKPSAFPVPPDELAASPPASFGASSFAEAYAFSRNLRPPRTYDWQVGIEQALGNAQRLGIGYVGAAGRNLVYWQAYYAGNQNHAVNAFSNDASSDYDALIVEYVRRLSRGLRGRVAYTWSHAIDVDSGEASDPNPPVSLLSPLSNRGSADFDRRHVLNVSASYRVPSPPLPEPLRRLLAEWQIDAVCLVTSGAPLSVANYRSLGSAVYLLRPDVVPGVPVWLDDQTGPTGQRLNADAFHDPTEPRQGTLGRNTVAASTLRQVDVALSRSIRLGGRVAAQLRLDAFNVFNIPNFGSPTNLLELEDFGRPNRSYATSLGTGTLLRGGLVPIQQVGGPRAIQLGIRVGW
jgi:hypothetical protein